jgi:CPA2 family monovalent cation:H+ antiporter-2
MADDVRLLGGVTLALGAGWFGGLIAHLLRLPFFVGYLLAGILIGPHGWGWVRADAPVQGLANLGVILLLFAIGVELSFQELARVRRVALIGGSLQIVLTIVLGYWLGGLLEWALSARIVLGFVLALSSTTVLVKLLEDRGESYTQYARITLGICFVQDLAAVLMVSLLPGLGDLSWSAGPRLVVLVGKAGLFLAGIYLMARFIIPRVFTAITRLGSREFFLITVMTLCMTSAALAHVTGLSVALGAFLAGLMISETDFHHEAFAIIQPLRDVFGLVFFVSLGMLADPGVVWTKGGEILGILAVLLGGKFLFIVLIVLFAGYHLRSAIMSGLALIPISEFSFVVVLLAVQMPTPYLLPIQYGTILGVAIISVILSPLLLRLGMPLYRGALRLRLLRRLARATREAPGLARARRQSQAVLLCGYGQVGRIVGEALKDFHIPLIVIDYDQARVAQLRREGVHALYGDAANPVLLQQVGANQARMGILCLPDSRSMLLAVHHLRRLHPTLPLVVRGLAPADIDRAHAAGAEAVVEAEFECGLELTRHALLRLGADADFAQRYIDQVRTLRYHAEQS